MPQATPGHRPVETKGRENVIVLVHGVIAGYIAVQTDRNEFLKKENARLDKEIDEIKKLKEESHLVSAMYKQFGSLDHMGPHFTSCLVIAVSNSMLYQEPLKLEGGELLNVGEKGFFEAFDHLSVAE